MLDGVSVSLDEMLQAREDRVQQQQMFLARHQKPLVSLTMVIPGAGKNSSGVQFLFKEAVEALGQVCDGYGWEIVFSELQGDAVTGSQGFFGLNVEDAAQIKKVLLMLEEQHPLGRLWDFDVLESNGRAISRTHLGFPPRQCFICSEAAHACARSKAHTIEVLLRKIESMINAAQIES